MAYHGGYGYYSQPTIGELKARAGRSIAAMRNKGRDVRPIIVEGRAIAKTWWGKAWCDNLTRYADFASRIARGKRYVRAGCVLDLVIVRGHVSALVQGTRKDPYQVEVEVRPLPPARVEALTRSCTARAANLEALTEGRFPEELKDALFNRDAGIFPSPAEISFACSCPDFARLCKHVASALFAVGTRLDDEPLLFFELRGIDTSSFVRKAIEQKIGDMLANADAPSPRILRIDDDALTELFGVL